jgi:hypothetical protein
VVTENLVPGGAKVVSQSPLQRSSLVAHPDVPLHVRLLGK